MTAEPNRARHSIRASIVAVLTLLAAGSLAPMQARAYELESLASCLAADARFEVAFRQERLMTSVNETLTSHGRMIYEPPDRLILAQEEPRRERAEIDGARMSVQDGDGNEVASFDLSERPGLKLTFDGIRGLLAGDAAALRAAFEVALEGGESGWRMTLKPRSEAARQQIWDITVDGGDCRVETIDVKLRDGGRRTIHLRPGETGG